MQNSKIITKKAQFKYMIFLNKLINLLNIKLLKLLSN